jgi:DNA invertase Pin-like site-specific DNA recombinase
MPELATPRDDCERRKTVLYCRTATGGMDTIETQLEKLRLYAERNGHIACAIAWDCNTSGASSAERRGLKKLLADVRCGDVERVVVYDIARLARCFVQLCEIKESFADGGTELIAVTDGGLFPYLPK